MRVEEDKADLTDEEIWGFCSLLHDVSQNTTLNMIANGVIVLGRHPEARHRLAEDPSLWGNAVEELLRYVSPVQGLARATTATSSSTTPPSPRRPGPLLYGAANHDEREFDDPETFDIDRKINREWTFGQGIHFCMGAAVAKLETRIALQCMVETLGDWEVDEAGLERTQLVPTRGLAHTPISFEAVR